MSRRASPKSCPLCGAAADPAHVPFCSRGCRDRDLLKWLGESYRIPAGPADPQADGEVLSGLDSTFDRD